MKKSILWPSITMTLFAVPPVLPPKPKVLLEVDLFQAALKGDAAGIQIALATGANPNAVGPRKLRPLFLCALKPSRTAAAEALIRGGAHVNAVLEKDEVRYTPLLVAAMAGNAETLQLLLKHGADPQVRGPEGRSLLALAAEGSSEIHREIWDQEQTEPKSDPMDQPRRADMIRALVRAGLSLESEDENGDTPLCLAARNGRAEALRALLEAGADPNRPSRLTGCTPLMAAAERLDVSCLRILLEKGADGSRLGLRGESVFTLFGAKTWGQNLRAQELREAYALLKKSGAKPAQFCPETGNFIHQLVRWGSQPEIFQALLECAVADQVPLNVFRSDGHSPLSLSIVGHHLEATRRLLDAGADVNGADPLRGQTPLAWAAACPAVGLVDLLLQRGAQVGVLDKDKRTVLHFLGLSCNWTAEANWAVFERLKKAGVNLHQVSLHGESLLDRARALGEKGRKIAQALEAEGLSSRSPNASGGHLDTALFDALRDPQRFQELLQQGASVKLRAACGHTVLHHVLLYGGTVDQVEALLKHGSEIHEADLNGVEPLAMATGKGFLQAAELLIAKGAHVSHRDKDSDTPLAEALANGHLEMAKRLLKAGALPQDAFRGDWEAWARQLREQPEVAVLALRRGDQKEYQAKGLQGWRSPWTYGALAAAVIKGDLDTLKRAQKSGLDLEARPKKALSLLQLAQTLAPKDASAALQAFLKEKASLPTRSPQ